MKEVISLIKKDFQVDLRQKYPIAGIVLYIFSTIYISYLAFNNTISPTTWNALYWMVLLFSSITGIAKSFSQEENRSFYYFFLTSPSKILLAKMVYHLMYQFLLVGISLLLFSTFLGNPVNSIQLFIVNLISGSIGIAVAFTLISSIASKTENQSTMMAILSFPVIIPVLLLAVTNSKKIVLGAGWDEITGNSITLVSVNIIIIALSFILFPYSWRN